MPLPTLDPHISYLDELKKDKPEVQDYLAGIRLIDDYVNALRLYGPHCKPHELQRLRSQYVEATIKCSALLILIEQRYFYPML